MRTFPAYEIVALLRALDRPEALTDLIPDETRGEFRIRVGWCPAGSDEPLEPTG